MNALQRTSLILLRLSLGWMFFYAGITKILDSAWSAAGYLQGAHTFSGFFNFLLQPNVLPIVNFLNEWGLTLIGVALILGIFVRLGSVLAIVLMALYYLPALQFPYPNEHAYLVDEHIIYIFAFLALYAFHAGRGFGLGRITARLGSWAE
ncbi:MAG: DoxX family protein [Patescibacteria group bacterium]